MNGAPSETRPGPPGPRSWAEVSRLARTVYDEFAFQSIYALKQGNLLADPDGTGKGDGVAKARRRVTQSKMMISFLLLLVISSSLFTLARGEAYLGVSLAPSLYATILLGGTLLLGLSLLWMTGLQVTPTLLGSRVFPILATLPLSRRDLERMAILLFLRIFDLPAGVLLVLFPVGVGLATGSWLAGLWAIPGALLAIIAAAYLSLLTGRFFLVRVSGSRGGTTRQLVARWVYLLLWTIPALAITVFISFSVPLLRGLTDWIPGHPEGLLALFMAFPFALAFLPSAAAYGFPSVLHPEVLVLLAATLYGVLGVFAIRWLWGSPLAIALETPRVDSPEDIPPGRLRRSGPVSAVMRKDLRIASRSPGYAFLILLPLLDAFVIGLSTLVENPDPASVERYALAAVTVAALLATFFGPAFFATEVLGLSFTRTLPITRGEVLLGKSALIMVIYILSCILVMALVVTRLGDPLPFLGFAAGELPAVVAAALLEIGIILHRAAKTGIPLTNLFSGAWITTLVVIPGLLVAGLPLVIYEAGRYYDEALALPSLAASGLVLLAVIATWTLWGRARPL